MEFIDSPMDSQWFDSGRVFDEDPSWISSFFPNDLEGQKKIEELGVKAKEKRKYNMLRRRQIKTETEGWEKAAEEYRELEREMCEKKLAPNLPYVKKLFLGWFEPVRDAIENEQKLQETKMHKASYGRHILLLPADKMAVIVMHKMMSLLMTGQEDGCVRVVQAAIHIGEAIEQEVRHCHFTWKLEKFFFSFFFSSSHVIDTVACFIDHAMELEGMGCRCCK